MKMRMIYVASETGLSHPFLVEEVLRESPAKFPNPNPRKFELAVETQALETTVPEMVPEIQIETITERLLAMIPAPKKD